ncbi:PASTA domain-containing protein [Burkholderia cenocepacia]|uniref:PASTA domain-containing protein n=1 Tax=Burkholderia cenocepacia TaxID=95486 RepID=UPI002237ADCD|nr:PASTA domain-containing protein [Burkholderia cenocepacia]MCW5115806.1 PASTA domain-containing protein [Burkholderia cenocepacia]MCW5132006.1 PASTA domain-containing protein [Burkholderia cenocepacia]MCW5176020.1 PASTA domain-containing protein [Burkholderia cenocepacia]
MLPSVASPLTRHLASIVSVAVLAGATFGGTASAEPLRTVSDIAGASLVPLGTLPHSPESGSLDPFCTQYRAKATTAAGREVAKRDWIVTSEAPLGRYTVVSFASGFNSGTSAICFARNGNLGVFDGATLVALGYTARKAGWQLGSVDRLENGALLVWGGDGPGAPAGELHDENGGLRLTRVAAESTHCSGRAVVPNVYGKPLDAARKILIAHGWQPLRPRENPDAMDGAATLAKHGIIEAEACSGTGVGYCALRYRNAAGVLGVTTVGGEPDRPSEHTVIDYQVACRKQ